MPYCTIQAAANVVNPGDTVLISGDGWGFSNYDENVVIKRSGTVSAPITFKAAQASFRLYGLHSALSIENATYVNVIGADVWTSGGTPITIAESSNILIDKSAAEPEQTAGIDVSRTSTSRRGRPYPTSSW